MNKFLCLLTLLLTFQKIDAQTPEWAWARSSSCYGPIGRSQGHKVASVRNDPAGHIYLTGGFADDSISFGPITLYSQNQDYWSIFLAKYDSAGNVLWAKNSSGTSTGAIGGIATDDSGNIYLTGRFSGNTMVFDSDTLNFTGFENVFLVKYDSAGTVLWCRGAGISDLNNSYSLTVDPFQNVYISGTFSGPSITFGSFTLTNSGTSSMFLVKYDPSGNVLWAIKGNNSHASFAWGITADMSGNTYVTGGFDSLIVFGVDTLESVADFDMFITKYDASGNVIWAKRVGGNDTDFGSNVVTYATDKFYITGAYESDSLIIGSDTLLHLGYSRFLASYDTSGNVLWAQRLTGGTPFGLALDAMDNLYMSGRMNTSITFDTLTMPLPNNSVAPLFLVKFNSFGHALWGKSLTSGGLDNGVALGPNGSIYTGGNFIQSPFIVGVDTLILMCEQNSFVAKLGISLTTDLVEMSENSDCDIYPNPFDDKLIIRMINNDPSEIIIYDIISRKQLYQQFTGTITLNTSKLGHGIYIYQVRNKRGVIKNGKIVKK